MANPGGRTKCIAAAVVAVSLALIVPVQLSIDSLRAKLVKESVMPTQLPLSAASSAALGGFRGIAVDILWMQSDSMLIEKQYYQLMTYYQLISILQPNFPTVWQFNAWNLAYNISAEWGRPEEKWLWVKKGIEFTKEGLRYNPDSPDLYFFLGWIYFHKIGGDDYFTERLEQESRVYPNLMAYTYFSKALELVRKLRGDDVRLSELCLRALFRHGKAVLKGTGNVPEAMRFYDEVLRGAEQLLVQYPDDPAVIGLLSEIKAERAKFGR